MNMQRNILKATMAAILLASGALATDMALAENAASKNSSAPPSQVTFAYQPPMRGAPAARIGGGTRGIGSTSLELVALAPDHTGLTTKEQPTLYWYLSEPAPAKLEVTLINDDDIDPELEETLSKPVRSGIQHIDLSETKARLKPGLEYRWFVSVVADPSQRSDDIVASGTIKRIEPDTALDSSIKSAGANKDNLARVYAENGIWYDAVDTLSRMMDSEPANSVPEEQLAALLDQVGLKSAAKSLESEKK